MTEPEQNVVDEKQDYKPHFKLKIDYTAIAHFFWEIGQFFEGIGMIFNGIKIPGNFFQQCQFKLGFDVAYLIYFATLTLTLIFIGHAIFILFLKVGNKSIKADPSKTDQLNPENQRQEDINIEQYNEDNFQDIFNQVYNSVISLFFTQTLYMSGSGLLLIFSTAYWFTPTTQSAIVCIFAFILGLIVAIINAYICLRYSVCTDMKIVTEIYVNQKGVLKLAFLVGSAISSFGVSLLIMILSTFFFIAHEYWNILQDGETDIIFNQVHYLHLTHSVLGYGVGICYASLFYRETAGQASRGFLAGEELIGRINNGTDESIITENNVKMGSIIASIYINNLVQYMDTQAILASLFSSMLIISAEVPFFTSKSKDGEFEYDLCFYAPMFLFCWFILVSIGIAWIINGTDDDNELVNNKTPNTVFQIKLQFFIVIPLVWIFMFIWPWIIYPTQSFELGDLNHPTYHAKYIFPGKIISCLSLGLILQIILIAFSEYCTSHYFQPTRNVAADTQVRSSLGLMQVEIFASNAQLFIIFLVASFIALSFMLAGFYGVGMLALGLLSSTITLLSINYLGGAGDDGLKCAQIAKTYGQVIDRILKMAWVVRNYQIYTQIINGTTIFIVNVVCIGAILILTKISQVYIWSGFTLFGFFYGSSLAYVLRGGGTAAARDVALELVKEYNDTQSDMDLSKQEKLINKPGPESFQKLMQSKYNTGIMRVSINIIISVVSILLIGGLFGGESIIGFVIGLNVVGLHITLMQLLVANSLKSAKFYKSIQLNEDEGLDQIQIQNTKDNLLYALTVESLPGSCLISYLAFNTLFVLLGSSAFAHAGSFREFIETGVSYMPEHSTKWLDKSQHYAEGGISSAMGSRVTGQEDYNDYPNQNGSAITNSTNATSMMRHHRQQGHQGHMGLQRHHK